MLHMTTFQKLHLRHRHILGNVLEVLSKSLDTKYKELNIIVLTYLKSSILSITSGWSTSTTHDRRPGRTASMSIRKDTPTESLKCVRSVIGNNRSLSAEGSPPPEPELI